MDKILKTKLRLVLIRPGETDLDQQGRITGSLDVPLSEVGQEQAEAAADKLRGVDLAAVYSGPCLAAQQTSIQITADSRVRPKVEPKLQNINMGLWQGREIKELKQLQPRYLKQWQENPEQVCPPGGEALPDVRPRIDAFLKKLLRKHKSGVVVIVVADPLARMIADRIGMLDANGVKESVSRPNWIDGLQSFQLGNVIAL